MSKVVWVAAAVVAVASILFVSRGPAPPRESPPRGTFTFAALGDAPYNAFERLQYRLVVKDIAQHDVRFVLHTGDLFRRPCSDDMYLRMRAQFAAMQHPVIYTPGDKDWTDCWQQRAGGFSPLERLQFVRKTFFANELPGLEHQAQYVEHQRWQQNGFLFATVHLVDSLNAMRPFPARTHEDDVAAQRRTEAAAAWLRETFAAAKAARAKGVVVAFHADAHLEMTPGDPDRQVFEPFLATLEKEAEDFAGPVLVVHGGGHIETVDHPLVDRTSHKRLQNVTRLEVPGSPDVGWVWVAVAPNAPSRSPFVFEPHIVPGWKFW